MNFEITKIGERGQVVIPQSVRDQMHLHKGDKFMVIARGDMLVLKQLRAPSKADFDRMMKQAQQHAKKHGLTEHDMWDAIKSARKT